MERARSRSGGVEFGAPVEARQFRDRENLVPIDRRLSARPIVSGRSEGLPDIRDGRRERDERPALSRAVMVRLTDETEQPAATSR